MKTSGQFQKKASTQSAPIPLSTNLLRSRSFPKPSATVEEASTDTPDFQARLEFARSHAPNLNSLAANSSGDRAPSTIQPKLTVGAPNDQYEQEADRVANQVMSMPDSATQQPIQREANLEEDEVHTKAIASSCPQGVADSITPLVQREAMPEEEELHAKAIDNTLQREEMPEEEVETKPALQRSSDGGLEAGGSIENRLNSSQGGGSPLPDDVRSFMEPRFGADFSQVRVHTGSNAVQMNRDLNAQAFTHKQDVYFSAGKAPGNDALMAHELTHVVQQTGGVQTLQSSDLSLHQKCLDCGKEGTSTTPALKASTTSEFGVQRDLLDDAVTWVHGTVDQGVKAASEIVEQGVTAVSKSTKIIGKVVKAVGKVVEKAVDDGSKATGQAVDQGVKVVEKVVDDGAKVIEEAVENGLPDLKLPEMNLPDISLPNMKLPDTSAPDTGNFIHLVLPSLLPYLLGRFLKKFFIDDPDKKTQCAHPIDMHLTASRINLQYGMFLTYKWKSSTESMEDLRGCFVTEHITFSKIPNPPFGYPDGRSPSESGTSQRKPPEPGMPAEQGLSRDEHWTPPQWLFTHVSPGKYTVTQTYDYKCSACGDDWIPFAHNLIECEAYQAQDGSMWFKTTKTNQDGNDNTVVSDEPIQANNLAAPVPDSKHSFNAPGVEQKNETDDNIQLVKNSDTFPSSSNASILREGSRGPKVAKVQEKLNSKRTQPPLAVDSIFGPITKSAVKSFQETHQDSTGEPLKPDGIVGRKTREALEQSGAQPPEIQPPEIQPPENPSTQPPNVTASVTVQPHIRSSSTPTGITADRIPPRVDTPISISLDGTPNPLAPIVLSIAGANGSNGTATINGAAKLALTGTQTVNLQGVAQTKPGNAGNLRLVARQGKTELASSSGFSVSAIPQDMSCDFSKEINTEDLGYTAIMAWKSDSGNTSDLNEVDVTESVQVVRQTGCMEGGGVETTTGIFISGARGADGDRHTTPRSKLTGSGFMLTRQVYVFRDNRTNSEKTIPIGNSGFQITRRVTGPDGEKSQFLVTEKKGVSTTVQDSVFGQAFSSNSGEGFIELTQIV